MTQSTSSISSYFYYLPIIFILPFIITLIYFAYKPRPTRSTSNRQSHHYQPNSLVLSHTPQTLLIHTQPKIILSSLFDYSRIPDSTRWRSILEWYKAAGLNSVTIPINWAYHTKFDTIGDEMEFDFDSPSKNLGLVLSICSELNIYTILQLGPNLGNHCSSAGLPIIHPAFQSIRPRHLNPNSLNKLYDEGYSKLCIKWLEAVVEVFKPFQISENKDTGVIMVELERNLCQSFMGWELALKQELKELVIAIRGLGITVPLSTCDIGDDGNFTSPEDTEITSGLFGTAFLSKTNNFNLDIYSIGKQLIQPPHQPSLFSSLISKNKGLKVKDWEDWNTSQIGSKLDHLENKLRNLSPMLTQSPLCISDLDVLCTVGPTDKVTYDDIHNYLGPNLAQIGIETCLSQGINMISFSPLYGGTNWSDFHSSSVITSHDLGAPIRECGFISDSYRQLRLSLLFIRSFSEYLSSSHLDSEPFITLNEPDIFLGQRVSNKIQARPARFDGMSNYPVEFNFFRNFDDREITNFDVQLNLNDQLQTLDQHEPFFMTLQLPYKKSLIGLGNYTSANGVTLRFSSKPIYLKWQFQHDGIMCEAWVIPATDNLFSGEMAFEGTVDSIGTVGLDCRSEDHSRITLIAFDEGPGWVGLSQGQNEGMLYLFLLAPEQLHTLYANFDSTDQVNFIGFGAYNIIYDGPEDLIKVQSLPSDTDLTIILPNHPTNQPPPGFTHSQQFANVPGVFERKLPFPKNNGYDDMSPVLENRIAKIVPFNKLEYTMLTINDEGKIKPTLSELNNYGPIIIYKYTIVTTLRNPSPPPQTQLLIQAQHFHSISINGNIIGTNTTHTNQPLRPGTIVGPELDIFRKDQVYELTDYLQYPLDEPSKENIIYVMVQSLGKNDMKSVVNDLDPKRGLLSIKFSGLNLSSLSGQPQLSVATIQDRAYPTNLIGYNSLSQKDDWVASPTCYPSPPANVLLYQAQFVISDPHVNSDQSHLETLALKSPIHVHINGPVLAYLFINDQPIGSYNSNLNTNGRLFIMDHIIQPHTNTLKVIAFKVGADHDHLRQDQDISLKIERYKIESEVHNFTGNIRPTGPSFTLAEWNIPI